MYHTNFQVDGVNYMLEANCPQAYWPRLIDKVHKFLEKSGKEVMTKLASCETASVRGRSAINKEFVYFTLTVNPKGLNVEIKRTRQRHSVRS